MLDGTYRLKKEQKNCTLKAILIENVERQIEQIYDRYSFDSDIKEKLEEIVQTQLDVEKEKFKIELNGLTREKEKAKRRQEKLLEAHFNDAIASHTQKSHVTNHMRLLSPCYPNPTPFLGKIMNNKS